MTGKYGRECWVTFAGKIILVRIPVTFLVSASVNRSSITGTSSISLILRMMSLHLNRRCRHCVLQSAIVATYPIFLNIFCVWFNTPSTSFRYFKVPWTEKSTSTLKLPQTILNWPGLSTRTRGEVRSHRCRYSEGVSCKTWGTESLDSGACVHIHMTRFVACLAVLPSPYRQ